MKKFIKKIFLFILVVLIIIVAIVTLHGYSLYQDMLSEASLDDRISKIESDGNFTRISDLPDYYAYAVIAVEDHRFYEHRGVDIIALGRAIFSNIRSGDLNEGGSTISQQVCKNVCFDQNQNFSRKVSELFATIDLEKNYDKDEIFEIYVNTSYFGSGFYGIYDACYGYFKKEPSDMTLYEATLLAGVPNAPSAYAPNKHPELAAKRQKKVISSMVEYDYLSQDEADDLLDEIKEKVGI